MDGTPTPDKVAENDDTGAQAKLVAGTKVVARGAYAAAKASAPCTRAHLFVCFTFVLGDPTCALSSERNQATTPRSVALASVNPPPLTPGTQGKQLACQ